MEKNPHHHRLLELLIHQNRQTDNLYSKMAIRLSNVLRRYKVNPKSQNVWRGTNSVIEKEVDKIFQDFGKMMLELIKSNIDNSWELSNLNADSIANDYIKGLSISDIQKENLFNRNLAAKEKFLTRYTNGMNLSERVWNITQSTKSQLEQIVGSGILEGQPAAKMSLELLKALKEPNRLFKRVRDSKGILKNSKPYMAYHPGRGTYRSSYQNAMRLARTEINMAYRTADNQRRQSMPFVTGFTVHLSNAHIIPDICNSMVGDYPKNFNFIGWHPHCLCYTTAKLLPKKDFIEYLNGKPIEIGKTIQQIPAAAQGFISENSSKFMEYKKPPYFLDNFKNVGGEYKWVP